LNLTTKKKNFHVIAGAFRFPENAVRKVEELKEEGYDARILGVNKWNLSVVSYGSFNTREEAELDLFDIKNTVAKDAWLLVQEF
jgi:cell division protein FtsN